jgi:hypothetical protein
MGDQASTAFAAGGPTDAAPRKAAALWAGAGGWRQLHRQGEQGGDEQGGASELGQDSNPAAGRYDKSPGHSLAAHSLFRKGPWQDSSPHNSHGSQERSM